MTKYFNYPSTLFLFTAVMVGFIPVFYFGQSVIIEVFGFKLWIDFFSFFVTLTIFLLLGWLAYHFTKRSLWSLSLTWTHINVTVIGIVLIVFTHKLVEKTAASDELQFYFLGAVLNNESRTLRVKSFASLIFFLAQGIYIVNLIAGVRLRKRSSQL